MPTAVNCSCLTAHPVPGTPSAGTILITVAQYRPKALSDRLHQLYCMDMSENHESSVIVDLNRKKHIVPDSNLAPNVNANSTAPAPGFEESPESPCPHDLTSLVDASPDLAIALGHSDTSTEVMALSGSNMVDNDVPASIGDQVVLQGYSAVNSRASLPSLQKGRCSRRHISPSQVTNFLHRDILVLRAVNEKRVVLGLHRLVP